MTSPSRYDAIVVGAGHNGLVTACYLARAGLRVLVLERRYIVGGACVSEETFPGYKVSTASYVNSLFHTQIVRDEYAPNFKSSVIDRQVLASPDLERVFNLTGGNIFQGAMNPGQLFAFRPVPGYARYKTPVRGLYLCGSAAHPGGGVMGTPGLNAPRRSWAGAAFAAARRLAPCSTNRRSSSR